MSFIIDNTVMFRSLEKLKDRFEQPYFDYQSTKALHFYIYRFWEIKGNMKIHNILITTHYF